MKKLNKVSKIRIWSDKEPLHDWALYETILDIADGKLEYEGLLSWVLEHQS